MKHLIILLLFVFTPFMSINMKGETAEESFQIGMTHYLYERYSEAVKYFEKAANQGFANAQFFLGVCYAGGEGVTEDLQKAAIWIEKAANQNHGRAQLVLGSLYENGGGVEKDLEKAKYWYQKALANGEEDAKKALEELNSKKK